MHRQHSRHNIPDGPARPDLADRPFTPELTVQAKLTVGAVNDPAEAEADRVADAVLAAPQPTPVAISAAPGVQRSAASDVQMTSQIEGGIQTARGGGTQLPGQLQGQMGANMGANFANVRVHTNTQADTLNRSLNARAFTTGSDIFFRQGDYNPGTREGQRLLAHELTHVVQQQASGSQIQRAFVKDAPSDAALFEVVPGADTQPDLSEHTVAKKGKLAITKVNMQHFLERHTYKHQQLSAAYRRYDATLWPVGTTVTEVLEGLNTVLKLMEGRTTKKKMVNENHTITMGGKSCTVRIGMISGNVLEQFFPISGAGTQDYTTAELAEIYAEKQKPVAKAVGTTPTKE